MHCAFKDAHTKKNMFIIESLCFYNTSFNCILNREKTSLIRQLMSCDCNSNGRVQPGSFLKDE